MSGKRNATGKPERLVPVLYDGWPLVYAPGSPAALHLMEILSALPTGVQPRVALPFAGAIDLPGSVLRSPTPDTPGGRLRWQQRALPALARQGGARWIHTTGARLPLFTSTPVIYSPTLADGDAPGDETFMGRIGEALGRGGLSGAAALLWPGDLPDPVERKTLRRLSPYVDKAYYQDHLRPENVPESYVLAPGPLDSSALSFLAAAWSWAQDGLGEDWALVVCDSNETALERLRQTCLEAGTAGRVEGASAATAGQRAALFQHTAAVLSLGPVRPWADPLLQALASGRPLVAEESVLADARTGPAAYLTPRGDARALGAALLTVIVEEAVGEQLGQAARQRAAAWAPDTFSHGLAEVYGIKNEGEPA